MDDVPICSKPFVGSPPCGKPATHAYRMTRTQKFVYRCNAHPIENKGRYWGKEYSQCKRFELGDALIEEVMHR